jgi:hypothetical protein
MTFDVLCRGRKMFSTIKEKWQDFGTKHEIVENSYQMHLNFNLNETISIWKIYLWTICWNHENPNKSC